MTLRTNTSAYVMVHDRLNRLFPRVGRYDGHPGAHAAGRVKRGQHKTHCPQGHPYDEANTYVRPDGAYSCRACHRETEERRRAERS